MLKLFFLDNKLTYKFIIHGFTDIKLLNKTNNNKFPLRGFILIAIGILIPVFVIVYISFIKKKNNSNKEE